jgi:hypothetical protein
MTSDPIWQLANIDLKRPVRSGSLIVPKEIELDTRRSMLVWSYVKGERLVPAGDSQILEKFITLSTASDEAILAYAKKWGVLGLCEEHGLPYTHNQPSLDGRGGCFWHSADESGRFFMEPLDEWRRYSRAAHALIQIAAAIALGKPGPEEAWLIFFPQFNGSLQLTGSPEKVAKPWLIDSRFHFQRLIDGWIKAGDVGPHFHWNKNTKQWQIDLTGRGCPNLFGLLSIQLMLAVAQKDGFAICSACHKSYIPEKQPPANRRRYCQNCRKNGVSRRDAQRDCRRRKEEAKNK